VTPAADVYALGAVLYELVGGQPPYGRGSLADLARKQAGEPVPPLRDLAPDVPPPLEAAVSHALALRPEQRPPTAGALAAELDPGAEVPAPTRVLRTGFRSRRRPGRGTLAAALAVVLFAIGLALALGLERDGNRPAVTRVESIERAASPEQQARNLAAWLRRHSAQPVSP